MRGLNKAYFIGHIGHDPEPRTTASGTTLLKLNIATPSARRVNDTWVEQPDWHRLTFFGKTADYVARAAHKGDSIAVECTVRPRRWTDEAGQARSEVSLVVERVLWLHGRNRAAAPANREEPEAAVLPPADDDEGMLPVA